MMCDPANCPAPSDECKVAACDAMGACIDENVLDGQDAPTQTAGDCRKNVCMGGSVMSQNDDNDPLDDMNDCTVDSCSGGVPSSDPAAMGAMCMGANGAKVCDGGGKCVECLTNADCPAANPLCSAGNICIPVTCDDGMLNGAETDIDCGGGTCDPCNTDNNCAADGDCFHGDCGGNGKCAAPTCTDGIKNGGEYLTGVGGETDEDCGGPCADKCGPGKGCNVNGDCDGNECTGMNGTCVPNCADGVLNNAETAIDCGGGTCGGCMVGQACGMSDSNCVMTAYCDAGTCAAKKAPGVTCAAMNECLMGICDPTDDVCCNVMCSGTCQSCKLAGSAGTCSPVPFGADPDSECAGAEVCNGANQCRKPQGEPCAANAECLNDICVDGVCCNNSCMGTCKACDLASSVGTCTNVPSGQDPADECGGALTCNGNGACFAGNGTMCAVGAQCQSGNCVDGVCCNTACNGTCESCNVMGSAGTCTPYAAGSDPEDECGGATSNCSGQSSCGLPIGDACTNNNQCASTFCADSVCCNSACTGDCKSCNLTGTIGTCSNVPNGQTDTCMGGQTCMMGACQ
jgi:hypothetical protein